MFQCIIQHKNGWIHAPHSDMKDTYPDIRLQLNEQLRCLDLRMESQVSLIQELQDFFRKRAEVEIEYSKSLEKLAKSLQLRHKEQKQKREQWPLFSSYACWQNLISQTKSLSKDHAVLSEVYSLHLVTRLQTIIEDSQRIYKKCRVICYETHEEIFRVLQEFHTTLKTYQIYQSECKAAEAKLHTAESQRVKLQQSIATDKLQRSKKYRLTEKEVQKRKNKYTDARLKSLKAKNEYQLCLEALNTTIHKYFIEDLSDLIDCMDLGFCSTISKAILMHVRADQGRCQAIHRNADNLSHRIQTLDCRADKQKFLEQNSTAFMIPKRIDFQRSESEERIEPDLQKILHQDMEQRLELLRVRLNNLRAESEEIWKTLETAEKNLLEHLNVKDFDTTGIFGEGTLSQSYQLDASAIKCKADKQEIEEFYLTKIREYILGTSKIARLDAKAEVIRGALEKDAEISCGPITVPNVKKRKRIGRLNLPGQPKLFGGSLEEYLDATSEQIPLIMRSCIRVINLFGLHHQGIFRVSGSQVEISNFRECFERGEDPLADTNDASDINSVAGVLKLYLRELREPLFPIFYFEQFISLSNFESKCEIVSAFKDFLQNLPRSVLVVLRYLFAFLNHLSEYADENMMDSYNLAICFGPTLMPAPEDKDQVQYQNQINDIIKNMIQYHEELFPEDLGGIQYEKYISDIDIDVGDSPTDQVVEDIDSEVYPSEDEFETVEATAQFDFNARSSRELSLRKGEAVVLRKQVSADWWQGTVNGKDGLVPDKYISLKIKDDDRDITNAYLKFHATEESIPKRRSVDSTSSRVSINGHKFQITSELQNNSQNPNILQLESNRSVKLAICESPIHQHEINHFINEKSISIIDNPDWNAFDSKATTCSFNRDAIDESKNKETKIFENSKDHEEFNQIQSEILSSSEELTSAERFVTSNQCTLKKKERLSSIENVSNKKELWEKTEPQSKENLVKTFTPDTSEHFQIEKKKLASQALRTDENLAKHFLTPYSDSAIINNEDDASPIPARNTQKYVNQFADLKLTGGCFNRKNTAAAITLPNAISGSQIPDKICELTPQFSSFKPQDRVKTQLVTKTLIHMISTPEDPCSENNPISSDYT